ncbi:bifunctional Saf4-Yju2 protein/WD40-repeat-containing domain superfamily [Babesia duncani]|uniref:Bifunctional Saf4-Yju2 protein/WD40-repeat-containing domain superfamily n=1 Tax=Babesia duncani TaxID=323732 RepID=A0AAD9PHW3_9APIC|nr:bifunctional Saf4-Yju2 protein/WD40-repeat-containing domain superfamily [Babesia duncani]
MSTLKAARADNFYYPANAEETHIQQRKRMRKPPKRNRNFDIPLGDDDSEIKWSGRGTVIRFEMPFKVICKGCNEYIAKGVRFDAERKAVGMYFSTVIYAFRMSCLFCHARIIIQTDPEHTDYICKAGVVKKVEDFDVKDAETVAVGHDLTEGQLRAADPLFILEQQAKNNQLAVHEQIQKTTVSDLPQARPRELERNEVYNEKKRLEYLVELSDMNNADDYMANSALRRRFRIKKKELQAQEAKQNPNFSLPLLKESEQDIEIAKKIKFLSSSSKIKSYLKKTNFVLHESKVDNVYDVIPLLPLWNRISSIQLISCFTYEPIAEMVLNSLLDNVKYFKWIIPANMLHKSSFKSTQSVGLLLVDSDNIAFICGRSTVKMPLANSPLIGVVSSYMWSNSFDANDTNLTLLCTIAFIHVDGTIILIVPSREFRRVYIPYKDSCVVAVSGYLNLLLEASNYKAMLKTNNSTTYSEELLYFNNLIAIGYHDGSVVIIDLSNLSIVAKIVVSLPINCLELAISDSRIFLALASENRFSVFNMDSLLVYETKLGKGNITNIKRDYNNPNSFFVNGDNLYIINIKTNSFLRNLSINECLFYYSGEYTSLKVTRPKNNYIAKTLDWIPRKTFDIQGITNITSSLLNPSYLVCTTLTGHFLFINEGRVLKTIRNPFKGYVLKLVQHPRLPSVLAAGLDDGTVYMIFIEPENQDLFHFTFVMKLDAAIEDITWIIAHCNVNDSFTGPRKSKSDFVYRVWNSLNRSNYDSIIVANSKSQVKFSHIKEPIHSSYINEMTHVISVFPIRWPTNCNSMLASLIKPVKEHLCISFFEGGVVKLIVYECVITVDFHIGFIKVATLIIPVHGKPTCLEISKKQYNQIYRYQQAYGESMYNLNSHELSCTNALQEFLAIGDDMGYIYVTSIFNLYHTLQTRSQSMGGPTCCIFSETRISAGIEELRWGLVWKKYEMDINVKSCCMCNDDIVVLLSAIQNNGNTIILKLTNVNFSRSTHNILRFIKIKEMELGIVRQSWVETSSPMHMELTMASSSELSSISIKYGDVTHV